MHLPPEAYGAPSSASASTIEGRTVRRIGKHRVRSNVMEDPATNRLRAMLDELLPHGGSARSSKDLTQEYFKYEAGAVRRTWGARACELKDYGEPESDDQ